MATLHKPRSRRFASATGLGLPTPASGCQPTFDLGIDAPATIPMEGSRIGRGAAGNTAPLAWTVLAPFDPAKVRRTGNPSPRYDGGSLT